MIDAKSAYQTPTNSTTLCYHCGDECRDLSIQSGDKFFCCHGCEMVHGILHDHGLDHFYKLNAHAGASQRDHGSSYAYLDDEDTAIRLLSYRDEDKRIVRFYLPQIHCTSCLWLLEHLPQFNPNITEARVNFLNKTLQVTYTHEMSLRAVAETLDMIGYAPHIVLDDLDNKKPTVSRSIYYKLGVAGFVFGNVMLMSFPEYLGLDADSESGLYHILPYLNIALTIPPLAYSGVDYFKSAWRGLRRRHLNIDVPVSLGLVALFGRSLYEITAGIGPGYLDSLAGLIFFLLIGKWFQQMTYARITIDRDYKSYFPIAATAVRSGQAVSVPLDKIEVRDTLRLRSGDLVPADALLVKGEAFIDYSFVSGESTPVHVGLGEQLSAGGKQTGGMIDVMVTKRVEHSYLTELWNDHLFNKNKDKCRESLTAWRSSSRL